MQDKENTAQGGAVTPMAGERAAARQLPGGYVYRIAGEFAPDEAVPPQAIVGGWQVDGQGNIVGEFMNNPNYDPALYPPPPEED